MELSSLKCNCKPQVYQCNHYDAVYDMRKQMVSASQMANAYDRSMYGKLSAAFPINFGSTPKHPSPREECVILSVSMP